MCWLWLLVAPIVVVWAVVFWYMANQIVTITHDMHEQMMRDAAERERT